MNKRLVFVWVLLIIGLLQFNNAYAGIEPFENFIKGNLKVGDSLWVKDEKFKNASFNWASLSHLSVKNYVSLKIIDDTPITQDFEVRFRLKVAYYNSPNQVMPTVVDTVNLNVNYKKGVGATYQLSDAYQFSGAHEIKVYIEEIASPQYGAQLPVSMQLSSGIVVDRQYIFEPYTPIPFSGIFNTGSSAGNGQMLLRGSLNHQVQLSVTIPVIVGADEYDLEWTPIDKPSEYSSQLEDNVNSITPEQLAEIFKNNATRVTLKNQQQYAISLIYNCEWIAVRVRGARYNAEGVRVEGVWSYQDSQNGGLAIWDQINWHESNLNWQYAATFAEEGKKKEVISYFDGSLRNRQTVTLLNKDVNVNDPIPVVQENIYDEFGRAAANILPSPVKETNVSTAYLKYFKGLNKNIGGQSYSFEDLDLDNCSPFPAPMNTVTQPLLGYNGAAGYYSANNSFLSQQGFNKFLPNAEGYPLSVNLYTPDNTGRLAKQGGVGAIFQPGSANDRTTKYYYGRPEQWELDAIFGNDAGFANRYQKNLVIDPNGQASVTYLNASGKTVATALTGNSPDNLTALSSASNLKDESIHILRPDDFKFDVSSLKLIATTTYVSSVIPSGNTVFKYDISQFISRYPNVFDPCSNCFYRLKISVKDDCGVEKNLSNHSQIVVGSALSDAQLTGLATGSVNLDLDKIGTYFVSIELALDADVIKDYADRFADLAIANGFLDKREKFVTAELKNIEQYFLTCFTGCDALTKLGNKEEFRTMFKQKLEELGEGPFVSNNTIYDAFIDGTANEPGLYQKLHDAALLQENACKTPALSACGAKEKLLLEDVSPNGQYALFDANRNVLEQETNVLYLHYRYVFSGTPDPEDNIVLEDGSTISPYSSDFELKDLVKYWKPAWAAKFIQFHPEFCKLQFCEDNYVSENWDSQLKKQVKAPTVTDALTGYVAFNQSLVLADWLVAHDPFFKTGGLGNGYAPLMALDLNEYSYKVLGRNPSVPVVGSNPSETTLPTLKNLLQVNLIQLYCSVEGSTTNASLNQDVWNNCTPKSDCREFDREWQLYRDSYLELKQKYVDAVRKTTRCSNACEVGKPEEVAIAPKPCGVIFTINSTGQSITNTQYIDFDSQGNKYTHNFIQGSTIPNTSTYCSSDALTPIFYPCVLVKYPGNTDGVELKNVWKVTCIDPPAPACSSGTEIYADYEYSEDTFVFFSPLGTVVYTVFEGLLPSIPIPIPDCPGYYYDCLKVYVQGEVKEYSSGYVTVCTTFNGMAGRATNMGNDDAVKKQNNAAPLLKEGFSDILAKYLSRNRHVLKDSIASSLLTDTLTKARVYSNYTDQGVYSILARQTGDSLANLPAVKQGFSTYLFKEHFVISTHPKTFVRFKNVWVAELLPDSGSRKYNEQRIADDIAFKLGSTTGEKAMGLALKNSGKVESSNAVQPVTSPCVMMSDQPLDYYDITCNSETYWNEWRRTTVFLADGNNPTTLPHDVFVTLEYVGQVGGPILVDVVIPAGQGWAVHEYAGELWDNRDGGSCRRYLTIFNCIKAVVGANLCFPSDGCLISCPPIYTNKISRFPVAAQQDAAAVNTDLYKEKNEAEIRDIIDNAADGHADNWMIALAPAIQSNAIDETLLYNKLKELTALAGTVNANLRDAKGNPLFINGLSSVPAPLQVMVNGTVCTSYGEILKVIFGKTSYTNEINPWLLEGPVPYPTKDVNGKFVNKMQVIPITISATNQEIVDKLESLKPYPNISAADFYTYLQTTFGNMMTLTLGELEALMKACGNCKFILGKDITLPVFLEPGTKGFITKAEYDLALADMNTYFATTPNDSWDNYETIVANFLNHRFGFALSYNQYLQFAVSNASHPTAKLANQPPYVEVKVDRYECAKNTIATAFYTADPLYDAYLAEEKKKFREAYIATCSAAKANFTLETQQNIYHYTLYYYDQVGNLIRTVPPAGVNILSNAAQLQVQKYREFGGETCNYQGPTLPSVTNTALQQLSNTLSATGNHALEFWLYQTAEGSKQLLASTPDHKYMLQLCVAGQQLSVDIYTLNQEDPNSITFTNSSHFTAPIGGAGALPWLHIVLQGSSLATGTLQLWVNGQQQTVAVNGAPAGCGWQVGGNSIVMPQNHSALKHLRHYNRLMTADEILNNAQNGCFMPSGQYLAWDRFNVPEPGDPTTVDANSTSETQYKDGIYPNHALITSYAYNSSDQVVEQQTPDAGASKFWYDYLNRLTFSQNAKQLLSNDYSYTKYDDLGRIIEVGQLNNANSLGSNQHLAKTAIANYLNNGTRSQLTQTFYDEKQEDLLSYPGLVVNLEQLHLRKRVVASVYRQSPTDANINASYYNYDLTGNVKTLHQQIAGLGIKKLDYEYDLVSGKVNFLAYQDGHADAFYYKYDYDAENRLINAWSSIDANIDAKGFGSTLTQPNQRLDASYQYYLHGPLARMELGDLSRKVQGLDYAYTLQGWLKGVNGTALGVNDIGADGAQVAKDALAFSLGYYQGDYVPIGGTTANAFAYNFLPSGSSTVEMNGAGRSLYNGNISYSTYAIAGLEGGSTKGYTYGYDQLNRLKAVRQHVDVGVDWNFATASKKFKEDFVYDANGNIEQLIRNGDKIGGMELMDQLSYGYHQVNGQLVNNRLRQVKDTAPAANYTGDVKDQPDDNYTYDAIGNLIGDVQEGIAVDWNVYGKIAQIAKSTNNIVYTYDAEGNRVSKAILPPSGGGVAETSYYVRDEQGNTLAVYTKQGSNATRWDEQYLYGSSRLGLWKPQASEIHKGWIEGSKSYELINHLGNVLAVINDNPGGNNEANVLNANDYYAFGSQMPGRKGSLVEEGGQLVWKTDVVGNYRYGFGGMEKDNTIKGEGNTYTTLNRIYDSRLGRWFSVDPEAQEYPDESPYVAMENNPVSEVDPEGDCPWCIAAIKGAVQEYATQVITNFAEGKDWKQAFTNVDGKAIVSAAIVDGLTMGVGTLITKGKTVVKVANALDKVAKTEKAVIKANKVATTTKQVSKVEKNVSKAEWKGKIIGKAQKTGTDGHRVRSYKEAIKAAKDPKVEKVFLDKGYNKAAGLKPGTIKPNRRPDATVVKKDGKVNSIEVQSKTDNPDVLLKRNQEAMDKLPAERQGSVKVVKPTSSNGN